MSNRLFFSRPLMHNQRLISRLPVRKSPVTWRVREVVMLATVAAPSAWMAHCWLGACTAV
ncbi:MAG: hypothetical protein ACRBC3_17080 [Burkholderiaceae bacterium]